MGRASLVLCLSLLCLFLGFTKPQESLEEEEWGEFDQIEEDFKPETSDHTEEPKIPTKKAVFTPRPISEDLDPETSIETAGDGTLVEEYDEDEFIGFEKEKSKPVYKPQNIEIDKNELILGNPGPSNYYLEGCFIAFIVLYLLNLLVGKRTNEQIARTWAKLFRNIFEENFSRVGDGPMMVKESHSQFRVSATGRINCIGLQAVLNLRRRHDLLAEFFSLFRSPKDLLTIDVAMEDMEPFLFAILPKYKERAYKKAYKDLESFGTPYPVSSLPEHLLVYTDAKELIPNFLHGDVVKTIDSYQDLIQFIWFSDQHPIYPKYKKLLRFVFKIPPISELEKMRLPIKMAIHFIDRVASLKLSSMARDKTLKIRALALKAESKQSIQEMQERAQKRKMEKLQKEKEDLEKLSPEERFKRERKMQKKETKKKNQMKFKTYKK